MILDLVILAVFVGIGWAIWWGAFRSCSRCLPGGGPCVHQITAKQVRTAKKAGTYREPAEWYVCPRCARYGTDPREHGCASPANEAALRQYHTPPRDKLAHLEVDE
jgi:hypothetical protein